MKKIIYLVPLLILASCISQSDYDQLKSEKEELEQEVSELKSKLSSVEFEFNQLLQEKRQAEIEKNRTPYISESEALKYIKDYYAFYDKDTRYRKIELRRVTDNSFKVSLEECPSRSGCDEFFWSSVVKTLTVSSNGDYQYGY